MTQVHAGKVPMSPTMGNNPITIQSPGVVFDPLAIITAPNTLGMNHRAICEVSSFDHNLGELVTVSMAEIAEDGDPVEIGVCTVTFNFMSDTVTIITGQIVQEFEITRVNVTKACD